MYLTAFKRVQFGWPYNAANNVCPVSSQSSSVAVSSPTIGYRVQFWEVSFAQFAVWREVSLVGRKRLCSRLMHLKLV